MSSSGGGASRISRARLLLPSSFASSRRASTRASVDAPARDAFERDEEIYRTSLAPSGARPNSFALADLARPSRRVAEEEACWICLDDRSDEHDELLKPCACPRWVRAARRPVPSRDSTLREMSCLAVSRHLDFFCN
eukprot:9574-Pelagococcus_subviridis.AAC.4